MKRPCPRHPSPSVCAEVITTRTKSLDAWPAPATVGRHRADWPGAAAERRLPFVCGKHVAPGGVR